MSTYGDKIKQLRKEHYLTQAELGEKLFVTPQAVSKWEKGLSEPDLNSIKKMCELFNVSMDEFLDVDRGWQPTTSPAAAVAPQFVTDISSPRTIEGYCEQCNKPLYAGEYEVFSEAKRHGRTTRHIQHVYCKNCAQELENKKIAEEQEREANDLLEEKSKLKKGFIIGGIIGGVILVLSIVIAIGTKDAENLLGILVGYCAFAFTTQLYMEDSIVVNIMGFFIRSFKMPGVIFAFSLEGLLSFIFIKLVLGALSLLLSVCLFSIGFVLALFLAGIVFPFQAVKYINKYKDI